jgi:23S rRNA (uracil1939-C5)-methyltransferase
MNGDLLTLDITKPAAGGRMLARHEGQVVLVWGAIPGERVRARIERRSKGVLYAETIDVLAASDDRREAVPDWRCGGNVFAHVSYSRQLQLKGEIIRDAFARIGRIPLTETPIVTGSPERGYRMRARLHVRGRRIGFIREGTHELCAVEPTQQMLSSTVAWIEATEAWLRGAGRRGLTSIELAENVDASERAAHVELEPGTDAAVFAGLAAGGLTGLSAQVLDRPATHVLSGVASVSDEVIVEPGEAQVSVRLRRAPRAFFQANRFLLDTLVRQVTALVGDGPVIDLYAGVGLFGLCLAANGSRAVTVVEGDPVCADDLEVNALPLADRVRVVRSSVEDFIASLAAASEGIVIVDPPRTGMSKEALAGVVRLRPRQIAYVSCDVATLARDSRLLVDAGYTLDGVSGIDLFPNTAHVETLCTFTV